MIKKLVLCALCCLMSLAARAQYYDVEKGDIIQINGVKAIVFKTDGNGHGKAMSVKALRGKKNAWCSNARLLKNFPSATDPDGEKNTRQIFEYIQSSRQDLASYPIFEWCRKLGPGWYVPSREDMEEFVNYYLGNEQDFDWDDESEFGGDSNAANPKAINEKLTDAGGVPFLGIVISGYVIGIYTSTLSPEHNVSVYQFNSIKNKYRFKQVGINMLDTYTLGRAFIKF